MLATLPRLAVRLAPLLFQLLVVEARRQAMRVRTASLACLHLLLRLLVLLPAHHPGATAALCMATAMRASWCLFRLMLPQWVLTPVAIMTSTSEPTCSKLQRRPLLPWRLLVARFLRHRMLALRTHPRWP